VRFGLSEDQTALRDAVRELLAAECPPAVVRAAWASTDGARQRALWTALAENGVLGVALPEDVGGLGLGACDLVPLLVETGRVALPLPIVETAFVAGPLLGDSGDPGNLLADVAGGGLVVACELGGTGLVPYAEHADLLLLRDGDAIRAIERGAATLEVAPSIDGARGLARVVRFAGAGTLVTRDPALVADACDRGALGTAAQLIGLGRTLLELTTAYVKERRQFGVPVGSFQAIKHHLANALLQLEFAAPAVLRAAHSLDVGAPERRRDVSMAKALASDAAMAVAALALQCHGAIAYTVEYDYHLYAMRVWATAQTWGTADWHRARIAEALGL
jgi:alkylation response protein AidB-like acyl-CoA dehydrogenase